MSDEEHDNDAKRGFLMVQNLIDVSADRLEGLRTQCATSTELIQQEIRTLEGKLIKLFSSQLVTKAKLKKERSLPSELKHSPSLTQWLKIVGLSDDSIQAVCKKVSSLEALHDKSDHELKKMLTKKNAKEEEIRRLSRALHNLRRYTEVLLRGDQREPSELHWDSWDRHNLLKSTSPRPQRNHITRKSVPSSQEVLNINGNSKDSTNQISHESLAHLVQQNCLGSSPSVSSRDTLSNSFQSLRSFPNDSLHSINKKDHFESNLLLDSSGIIYNCSHSEKNLTITPSGSLSSIQTGVNNLEDAITEDLQIVSENLASDKCTQSKQSLGSEITSLLKTKSQESHLESDLNTENAGDGSTINKQIFASNTSTLNADAKIDVLCSTTASPLKSPRGSTSTDNDETSKGSLTSLPMQPRSPRNPIVSRGMGHQISHRFIKTFKMMSICDFCEKPMYIGTGLSCKECKFRCHKECGPKVPPSCGLPQGFVDEFKKLFLPEGYHPNSSPSRGSPGHLLPSALLRRDRQKSHPQPNSNTIAPFQGPDSSSNTSSCNSSTPSSPALQAQNVPATPQQATKAQFNFPEVSHDKEIMLETHTAHGKSSISELVDTRQSNDSDKTVSLSGSNSTDSERTPVRVDSVDGEVASGELRWPRQNSLSMREWDIPYDELHLFDVIGKGRFGTVHRGNWHGDVAIKVLDTTIDYVNEKKSLDAFKLEVSTFRKTRHENVVLFMGACMKPPHLAIVTALCKGMTLYTHIHLRKDKFNMNRTTLVAQQIAQGMGYLHARGIVHKDLKSKNIFLENGKVVITDFGLFSVTKLCYGNSKNDSLGIPTGWLCYLAPEVIRSLRAHQKCHEKELPFTQASDVYAFGTVWYELLCGEWPFKGQPPEAIIWQVGRGMKQTLANLQASRDVKDILMHCWSYHCGNRPDFTQLLNTLEKLPKKRLARSPSHPVHLSRSAESVF